MRLRSLKGRLTFGLTLSLLVVVASAWVAGHEALHHVARVFVLSRLGHDADALVAAVDFLRGGLSHVGRRRLTPIYNQPYSGHYFVLSVPGRNPIYSRSLWDRTLDTRPLAPGETAWWHAAGPQGQRLLVWGGGFRKQGQAFSVAMAEDVSPLERQLWGYEWVLAGIAGGGMVLILLVQWGVIAHTFRRLQPVYDDIERLERGEAVALSTDLPDEVLPLVHKINRLLEQYRQRLERSRRAAGNLAHALKGPLSLAGQQAEQAEPALRERLGGQLERIRQLMERELKRARFAGSGGPGQELRPGEELPTLARLLEQMHPAKPLRVDCRFVDGSILQADREDMLELIGNLLDNACKWAASRVLCTLAPDGEGGWILSVEDDGPGCSDEVLSRISSRGVRLDEAVDGHGLGLSIVEDIVALYHGRIDFGRSEDLGGFRARVTLPTQSLGRG
jgi:signal transduction histidine kinase